MIRISDSAINPEQALKVFRQALGNAGAIASFTGVVRDDGKTEALTLSHYSGFTERQIEGFVADAKARWDLHYLASRWPYGCWRTYRFSRCRLNASPRGI